MQYFFLLMKLMPLIMELCTLAEKFLSKEGIKTGAEKKAAVMQAVQTIFISAESVSTGGQADTWKELEEPVAAIIEAICAFKFK